MTHPGTMTVWTVGHSTRSAGEFIAVLDDFDIQLVADVRRFPGSRRLPQFSQEQLEAELHSHGIDYCWLPELGGRRSVPQGAAPTAWRHRAFQGYADHMLGEEFADGLMQLLMLAGGLRTVIMCAEVLWWRCHRRIISDVLVSLGVDVIHIRDVGQAEPHRIAPPGRIVRGALTYRALERRAAE